MKKSKVDETPPVDLVVLSADGKVARCCFLDGRPVELTYEFYGPVVTGQVITVRPDHGRGRPGDSRAYGEVLETRVEVDALGLEPLPVAERGPWDPAEEYWRDDEEPWEDWQRAIAEHGERTQFEIEAPWARGPEGRAWWERYEEAAGRAQAGDVRGACALLQEMLDEDLRCLPAHAMLGELFIGRWPAAAQSHFEVGLRIGEAALRNVAPALQAAGESSGPCDIVLPWGWIGNRAFLRCLFGYADTLWNLFEAEPAERVYERLLWLNPGDNQGVRFELEDLREKQKN